MRIVTEGGGRLAQLYGGEISLSYEDVFRRETDKKRVPEGTLFSVTVRPGLKISTEDYFRMISTRRFCGSRVFLAVATSGLASP